MLSKIFLLNLLIVIHVSIGIAQTVIDNKQAPDLAAITYEDWIQTLITGAKRQIGKTLSYNPAYKTLLYPNGDVPVSYGVCTDVIIRGFRAAGIDLQKLVHEDMKKHWSHYPKKWGLKRPDKNIDHRRVPNLAVFFERVGMKNDKSELLAGDIVIWDLGGGTLHIGLLSDAKAGKIPLVIHNICCGVKQEDILNEYTIVATYRLTDAAIKKLKKLCDY
ncbi:MAG: DUF1287 domain-containing protein [Pseudomonadota bacterium]